MVRQRSAKPPSPVQIRAAPPNFSTNLTVCSNAALAAAGGLFPIGPEFQADRRVSLAFCYVQREREEVSRTSSSSTCDVIERTVGRRRLPNSLESGANSGEGPTSVLVGNAVLVGCGYRESRSVRQRFAARGRPRERFHTAYRARCSLAEPLRVFLFLSGSEDGIPASLRLQAARACFRAGYDPRVVRIVHARSVQFDRHPRTTTQGRRRVRKRTVREINKARRAVSDGDAQRHTDLAATFAQTAFHYARLSM